MPRRFMFKLQSVLNQRERAEDQARIEFAATERERLALEQGLKAIQVEIDASRAIVRSGLSGQSDAAGAGASGLGGIVAARAAASGILHLNARAQRGAMELAGAMRRCEMARVTLTRAMAARKAMELLRDKAREEHRQMLLRAEAAALDELTIMRHARRGDDVLTALDERANGSDS